MKLKRSNISEAYIKQYHGSIHFHALAINCSIITTSSFGSVVGYGSGCSFPKIETVAFSITRVPI
jgi:hypothetical protein